MKIVSQGYRFVYEPDAYAMETASATIQDEWKRKVRISAGRNSSHTAHARTS
jgi:biofilm PGA synthesis N-glycosyltransferase PgaC